MQSYRQDDRMDRAASYQKSFFSAHQDLCVLLLSPVADEILLFFLCFAYVPILQTINWDNLKMKLLLATYKKLTGIDKYLGCIHWTKKQTELCGKPPRR